MTSPPNPPAWTEDGIKHAESSLPSPDEALTDAMIRDVNRNMSSRRKKFLYMMGAGLCLLVAIIGISAGTANKKQPASVASSENTNLRTEKKKYLGPRESAVDVNQPRVQEAFEFLSDWVSPDILDGDTAQRASALWISGLDPRVVPVPPKGADYHDSFLFMQRYILGVFWYTMDGFHWNKQMSFMSHTNECDWNEPINDLLRPDDVDPEFWTYGVQCDEKGHVSQIRITSNNLKGELPREIGLLVAMKHFSVFGNGITGQLPDSLQFWQHIEVFAAERNSLRGPLPPWASKWTGLKYLALANNEFDGPLPSFSGLSSLKQVSLANNKFTGGIDVFNDCLSLRELMVNDNKLDGEISANTLSKLGLDILDASDNNLEGAVPAHFYNVRFVDLHSNDLGGSIPEVDFAEELNIDFFSVYGNRIFGSLPVGLGFLSELKYLDVSDNELSGPIPGSIAELTNLHYLYLANNPFEAGPFPNVWRSTGIREIVLRNTQRTGGIPDTVATLNSLMLLDVAENSMSGEIPPSMGALTKMQFLFLNRNNFSGSVPGEFVDLQALKIAMLDKNDLVGSVGPMCVEGLAPTGIDRFVTDCDVTCTCCTMCCEDSDSTCNSEEYLANIDGGFKREQFVFSEDVVYFAPSPDE